MASPARRTGAWAALAVSLVLMASARAERLPARVFGTADGLANARVYGVAGDARGFLWFATVDGANRFDGVRFETFGVADGLPDPVCLAVHVTTDGTIWMATERGLARLDPEQRGARPRFRAIHVGTTPRDDAALTLFEDADRRLWVGSEGGLWRVEADGTIAPIALGPGRQPHVYAITEDGERSLWLGTSSGLVRRAADGRLERYGVMPAAFKDDRIRSVLVDRAGRLWVGGLGRGVLALVPPPAGTRIVVEDVALWDVATPARAADGTLRTPRAAGEVIGYGDGVGFPPFGTWWGIRQDAYGDVWFGARRLTRFDGARFTQLGPDQGFPGHALAPAAEDRAGNLWFGSQVSGAVRLAPRGMVSFDSRDGLEGNHVSAVMEDAAGTIHATTDAGGHVLNRLDGNRFVAVVPRLPEGIHREGAWGVAQIDLVDRDGRWWYATQDGAAHYPRVASIDELATTLPEFFGVAEGLPGRDVLRMFEDSRGDVWLATMSATGVGRWDRDTNRVVAMADPALPSPVWAFAEDRGGGVWLGHDDGRLTRLPGGSTNAPRVFGPDDGLPPRTILSLLVDHLGRLWVAGHGGVVRLDDPQAARPTVTSYTAATGLGTDFTLALAEDARGRIYVGTMRGVDRIDPTTGAIAHLSIADGLPLDSVQDALRDRRGALWFATSAGLARLVPDDARTITPPLAYLMRLRAGGTVRALAMGGARAAPAITLGPGEGQLDIEFTSPSFEPGQPVELQYRLVGADRAWSAPGPVREVHYAHLAPGDYRFQVRARYPGGETSEPAEVAVEVLAPIWRRAWFIAAAATLLGLFGWLLYRWRVQHLVAVERVRTRIATDLHDDLGASLSRISILAEVAARRTVSEGGAIDVVDDIGRSARDLVDVASDIVWSTDPARDDLGSLLVRLRGFAGDVLEARSIAWSLDGPAEPDRIRLDPDERRHLYLVIKEAINNAARHSGAARVRVDVRRRGSELVAVVEDDGRGLERTEPPTGNGLRNMGLRAREAGGTLVIDAPPGGGTRVTLRIPVG